MRAGRWIDHLRVRFSRLLHNLITRVNDVIDLFKKAHARAGIWWVIFVISVIVPAVSLILLVVLFYLYL